MNRRNKRPAAFILTSTNHGSMLVNRYDYQLVENGGYGVGYQLLQTSSFDHDEVDLVLQLLEWRKENYSEGVVALDCGANIGVHTIEWAKFMSGWGSVIAFEPQERIYYALAGNITVNNCFNARALWAAVGSENGIIRVPVPDYFMPSSFGSLEIIKSEHTEYIGQDIDYSDHKTQVTPLLAIDNLRLDRVDFIKIDIEGMEMDALFGAKETIRTMKPQLLIEKIKSNENDIKKFVSSLGYNTYSVGLNLLAIHTTDPVLLKLECDSVLQSN